MLWRQLYTSSSDSNHWKRHEQALETPIQPLQQAFTDRNDIDFRNAHKTQKCRMIGGLLCVSGRSIIGRPGSDSRARSPLGRCEVAFQVDIAISRSARAI